MGGGIGRDGQGGIGRQSGNPNNHRNYEWQVTGINRNMIKVYPSYRFEQD